MLGEMKTTQSGSWFNANSEASRLSAHAAAEQAAVKAEIAAVKAADEAEVAAKAAARQAVVEAAAENAADEADAAFIDAAEAAVTEAFVRPGLKRNPTMCANAFFDQRSASIEAEPDIPSAPTDDSDGRTRNMNWFRNQSQTTQNDSTSTPTEKRQVKFEDEVRKDAKDVQAAADGRTNNMNWFRSQSQTPQKDTEPQQAVTEAFVRPGLKRNPTMCANAFFDQRSASIEAEPDILSAPTDDNDGRTRNMNWFRNQSQTTQNDSTNTGADMYKNYVREAKTSGCAPFKSGPKTAGIPTKVCPLRQTFEPCDHGFGHYVTHKY